MCLPSDRTHQPPREHLRFADAVQEEFGYLSSRGFVCTSATATLVSYESRDVSVRVYHGRSSYEIGIEVGLLSETDLYTLSELIALTDEGAAKQYRKFVAGTPELVKRGVELLKDMFARYGDAALTGDPQCYAKLAVRRLKKGQVFAQEVKASQVRPLAEKAFREKDYAAAARLYSSIQPQLTPAELKKLAYALRRGAKE